MDKGIHDFLSYEEINREIQEKVRRYIEGKKESTIRTTFSFVLQSLFEVAEPTDAQQNAFVKETVGNSFYQAIIAMLPRMTFFVPCDAVSEELNNVDKLISTCSPATRIRICVDHTFERELRMSFDKLCRLVEQKGFRLQLYCATPSDEKTCLCLELNREVIEDILQGDLTYRNLVRRIDNPLYMPTTKDGDQKGE